MSKAHPGLPIPDDWSGTEWCRFSICWPKSPQWRQILAGFITTPSLGRAWDGATGTITDAQQIGREIVENNLPWRYTIMATCDDGTLLADAMRYLADRLYSKPCCPSGGTGVTPGNYGGPGTVGTGGTDEPATPDIDPQDPTPPDGYETWDAYFTDLCDKATWLVNTMDDDLGRLTTAQLVGVTALTLAPILVTLFLTPIPGARIFAIASLLIAIASYGLSTLTTLKSTFAGAKDDLICALYTANGPASGRAAFLGVIRDALEAATVDPVQVEYGVTLTDFILSDDGLNIVYTLQPGRTFAAGDCSGCEAVGPMRFYYANSDVSVWTPLSYTRDANTFTLGAVTAQTINGIPDSVLIRMEQADPDGLGYKVDNIVWPSWVSNAGAAPREAQAWDIDDVLAVDKADATSLAEIIAAFVVPGHIARTQLWSLGGSIAANEVEITVTWETS